MPGLTSLLLFLTSAQAAPKESREAPSAGSDQKEGTLWDVVRARRRTNAEDASGGADPGPEETGDETSAPVDAEPTLPKIAPPGADTGIAAEREAESSFLEHRVGTKDPSVGFYDDPVAALDPDPLHRDLIDPTEFDIPLVVNDEVVKWMEYFTGRGSKWYRKWLSRSSAYRPMMYAELDREGLPHDIVYLSMIESGYSTDAYSTAAAVGLWQFIASTGREYGLRIDSYVDERRDPWMSTESAIQFLEHLYAIYGDWYLAFAAYNAGPGKVNRAIEHAGSKDFWTIVKSGYLRDETENYVPKLLAAAIIGKHPERYGFGDVVYQPELVVDTVTVADGYDLEVLSECAGLTVEEFQKLNPHIRQGTTPDAEIVIRLPVSKGQAFQVAAAAVPESERIRFVTHRVKAGETLGVIAKHYGVSVGSLQTTNHIKNANQLKAGQNLVIPRSGAARVAQASQLAALESPKPAAPALPVKAEKVSEHVVKPGETLGVIAAKYGVRTSDLVAWNDIDDVDHITSGTRLTVKSQVTTKVPQAAPYVSYTVRSGDTLSAIATRHGCSVDELRNWNSLHKTTIYPGQTLKVRKT